MRTEEELAETEQDIEIMNILGAFEGYNPIAAIEVSRYVTDKVITAVKNAGVVIKNENTTDAICVCGHTFDWHFGGVNITECRHYECGDCEEFTPAIDATKQTVKQKLQAEIRELKLERDSLQRQVKYWMDETYEAEERAKIASEQNTELKRKVEARTSALRRIDINGECRDCNHNSKIVAAALKEMEGK